MEKFAHEKLYGLFRSEMASQLESIKNNQIMTKQMVKDKLEEVLLKVKKSLEP